MLKRAPIETANFAFVAWAVATASAYGIFAASAGPVWWRGLGAVFGTLLPTCLLIYLSLWADAATLRGAMRAGARRAARRWNRGVSRGEIA